MLMLIYKIISKGLWQDAEKTGVFNGAPVDLADGFIHFSTAAQVQETARRHFRGQSDLLLLTLDDHDLGEALIYEPSRGGDLFPHFYGPLATKLVTRISPLPLLADGTHDFEGLLP
ncbi:MAG: DUF952 domain-containing protein [Alphaproteobacteria bacterium]|nr:DUF952 domain-containing protein [Alphaproteobacteria bacterium]